MSPSDIWRPDMVNHPPHYTTGKIEVLDFILDKFADDYLLGQVCKYISRARHKGSELEDLRKAEFYLKRRIAELEAK
jgi:hypothetical protein